MPPKAARKSRRGRQPAARQTKITEAGLRMTRPQSSPTTTHDDESPAETKKPTADTSLEDQDNNDEEEGEEMIGFSSHPGNKRIYHNVDERPQKKRLTKPRKIEIHQEDLSETDKMLRQFDLDYKYGPCVGLTRLERWERAKSLGLDPPIEVKRALEMKREKYKECLFFGRI